MSHVVGYENNNSVVFYEITHTGGAWGNASAWIQVTYALNGTFTVKAVDQQFSVWKVIRDLPEIIHFGRRINTRELRDEGATVTALPTNADKEILLEVCLDGVCGYPCI